MSDVQKFGEEVQRVSKKRLRSQKRISDRDERRVPMRLSDFLARAWKLANDKARELGLCELGFGRWACNFSGR